MKTRLSLLVIIFLIGWSSCTNRPNYPLAMQEAESYMKSYPDSALYLLETLADSISSFPEETQMYYHLLCIQAKDKQYIEHTDDSLINCIVEFYEDYDNAEKQMMAYYYQGSVYRDMNDAPRALKAFQQAVDVSKQDNVLLAKAYNQMGSLFMYQGLYDEAIKVNRKNIELYTLLGKHNKTSYALRDIARMYGIKAVNDSALFYYKKAYETALADSDTTCYYDILGEYGGFNYQIGDVKTAKLSLLIADKNLHKKYKYNIYLNLGNIYKDYSIWDSAYYYYQKTLDEGDIYSKYYTYQDLSEMESLKGNPTGAFEYLKLHIKLKDSIDIITQTEAIAKINSLYNYHHKEKEIGNLKLRETQNKNTNLILLLILLIILIISSFIILYQRRKNRIAIEQTKKLKEIEETNYRKSIAAINENNEMIAKLDIELKDAQEKNNLLRQKLILTQKEILAIRNKEIIASNNEYELQIATFKQSSIFLLLQRAATDSNIKFTDKNWEEINYHINLAYPNFTTNLYQLYPQLSIIEIRICWLIKLSFSPAEIARILLRTKPAISNARVRLYKKIHKKDGSADIFDEFIRKL